MVLSTIVLLPGISALFSFISRKWLPKKVILTVSCFLLILSAGLTGYFFTELRGGISEVWFSWFQTGQTMIDWSVHSDALVAIMLVVVTFVSTTVHIYSVGYMQEDPEIIKFISFLGLFTFLMLMLVTADNLVQLFLGWEGVGLASYLLIGFWYHKPAAANASFKAFIVNRVGDIGLALGICLLYLMTGSVFYETIFSTIPSLPTSIISVIAVCLLIGAMGKSAQLGLHVWLPDAMEGPTPVSALIHAATMVTAGIYMIIRLAPLFQRAPLVLEGMIVLGSLTALFAALTALTQTDIKKIIAYSTCSQLGYMMMACGLSCFNLSAYHLMTHAFFKALLFLGAGSVIHAFSGEQDIRQMGGAYKHIPYTYLLMWVGSLSLAGVPGFAGYYSKDAILMSAWAHGTTFGLFAFWIGLLTAGLTAFYSFRLLFKVFHGPLQASDHVVAHIHESPMVMLGPLLMLGLVSLVVGPYTLSFFQNSGVHFWHNTLIPMVTSAHSAHGLIHHAPTIAALSGILLATLVYLWRTNLSVMVMQACSPVHQFFYDAFRFDALYSKIILTPFSHLSTWLKDAIDQNVIDRFGPHGFSAVANRFASMTRTLQSGFVHDYMIVMICAICLSLFYIVVRI